MVSNPMDLDGRRRSDNFEDRGDGGGGYRRSGGSGLAPQLFSFVLRRFGLKGALVAGLVFGGVYLVAPEPVRQAMMGSSGTSSQPGKGTVCDASPKDAAACDFSRAVLASTEDVWSSRFATGALPSYPGAAAPKSYQEPTLVVFRNSVSTGGCGGATSAVGPFYCSADRRLYIDPSFYDTMSERLRSPGDFAQAFVLAHEVGHHIQNLIGSLRLRPPGESKEQASVRAELQADCLAGVWGHASRADLKISDEDLAEALQAAHAIGDDALGHRDASKFTHGSSAQRVRWFRRGFQGGDARACDTFAVKTHADL